MELGGNPFAPHPHRPKAPAPANARLPVARLRGVGAPPAVIAEAERRWAGANPEERRHAREAFDALTDDELVAEMGTMETALAWASIDGNDGEPLVRFLQEAADQVGEAAEHAGTIPKAREWVGEDRTRALAMLAAERRRADTEQRSTLLEALQAQLRAD